MEHDIAVECVRSLSLLSTFQVEAWERVEERQGELVRALGRVGANAKKSWRDVENIMDEIEDLRDKLEASKARLDCILRDLWGRFSPTFSEDEVWHIREKLETVRKGESSALMAQVKAEMEVRQACEEFHVPGTLLPSV
ncbi:hypothetical protein ACLOJK_034773 [Asimina triloba]